MTPVDFAKHIIKENFAALGQLNMGLSELDKFQPNGESVGIYRIREAAKMFQWCAERASDMADDLEKIPRPGARPGK